MSHKKFNDEEEQKIVESYNSGVSSNKIAEQFNTNGRNICGVLKRHNVEIRSKTKMSDNADTIITLYNEGLTAPEIRVRLDIGLTSIYRVLHKADINPQELCRTGERKGCKLFDANIEKEICDKYLKDIAISALAKEYDTTHATVRNILIRNDIERRRRGGLERTLNPEQIEELRTKWRDKEDILDILEHYKIGHSTLCRWLRQMDEEPRRGTLTGENHGSWKGGTSEINGYKFQWISKDDPFHSMSNYASYVSEHRYVMAKHIGRPLLKTESVHHIDGDIENNCIENLQLRTGQHGSGQLYCCADCGSRNIKPIELD